MKDRLGNGGKKGKKDVGTTLSKRERDRRKIAQAVGRRGRSPTRDLDSKTRTEPRTFGQPRTHVTHSPNTRPSIASRPINPRPVTREPAHHRATHQPAARHPRAGPSPRGPSPAYGLRPASGPLTRASTRDACTHVALGLCHVSRLQRGYSWLRRLHRLGGGSAALAAYWARETCFQPV